MSNMSQIFQPSSAFARRQILRSTTGYDRATLNRGGWTNPFLAGDHYAVGQPLLAAKVGGGVTSGGVGPAVPTSQLARR